MKTDGCQFEDNTNRGGAWIALLLGAASSFACGTDGVSNGNGDVSSSDTTSEVSPTADTDGSASTSNGTSTTSTIPMSSTGQASTTSGSGATSSGANSSPASSSTGQADDEASESTATDTTAQSEDIDSSSVGASTSDNGSTVSISDGNDSSASATSEQTSGENPPNDFYPCEGADPADYDVAAIKAGTTWTVTKGAQEVYSGADFQQVLTSAYGALTSGRSSKESILIMGDGELGASIQLGLPSYTILNVCGTIDVSGTPSGSDRSPFYARNASNIDIPNLKLTGSPQYGLFFRQTNDIHLGRIDLRLTRDAGIGIRIDSGPNAGSTNDFNTNLTIDYVYGSGMGSHIVETYGIDQIDIGEVEGEDVGECGLLLNRSINAEVGSVTCTDCATGTGYAAFRVANSVGKVGNDFPDGNIHVGQVTARGGGRGIFSVSGCGGLVIDEIDIADTGNTSILMQNTYNTVIAAVSGVVSGGVVQLTNDTDNTNEGVYPPSKDVTLQNLTLSNGASVRQDWCEEFGSNGCSAVNITGGNVSMCD